MSNSVGHITEEDKESISVCRTEIHMPSLHKNALSQIRGTTGLTQSQIADQIGVSKATYSAWETGRAELGANRLIALSHVLKCTPNDILCYPSGEHAFSALTKSEEEFVSLLRSLPPNIKEDILDIMRSTVKSRRIR